MAVSTGVHSHRGVARCNNQMVCCVRVSMGSVQDRSVRVHQDGFKPVIQRHLASASMAAFLLYMGLHLWTAFAPVTLFFKASDWHIKESGITADLTGYKIRNCEVVRGSAVGWQQTGAGWTETPFTFMHDSSPDSTRPAELRKQSFGTWRWTTTSLDHPVRLTVQHECDGVVRTSIIGPFTFAQ